MRTKRMNALWGVLLAAAMVSACAPAGVAVGTGIPYTGRVRAAVISGARNAGCQVGRGGGGLVVSCPTRRGILRDIHFVNEGGQLVAICYDRTPAGCSRYAQNILAGAGPVRIVVIRR